MTRPSHFPLKICRSSVQSRRPRWSGLTSDTSLSLYSAPRQSAIAHTRRGRFHRERGRAGLGLRPKVKRSSRIWPFSFDRGKGLDAQAASLSIMPASPLCRVPSAIATAIPSLDAAIEHDAASDRRSPQPQSTADAVAGRDAAGQIPAPGSPPSVAAPPAAGWAMRSANEMRSEARAFAHAQNAPLDATTTPEGLALVGCERRPRATRRPRRWPCPSKMPRQPRLRSTRAHRERRGVGAAERSAEQHGDDGAVAALRCRDVRRVQERLGVAAAGHDFANIQSGNMTGFGKTRIMLL